MGDNRTKHYDFLCEKYWKPKKQKKDQCML